MGRISTFFVLLSSAASLAALSGCEDSGNPVIGAGQPDSGPARTASVAERLKQKYSKATLFCRLNFPVTIRREDLTTSSADSDSFEWDLLQEFTETRSFKLKTQAEDAVATVQVDVASLRIFDSVKFDETGTRTRYSMQHSPVIQGSLKYRIDGPNVMAQVGAQIESERAFTFFERVPVEVSEKLGGAGSFITLEMSLSCLLETKANPGYENEFSATQY